jgi:ArsR family transcriptional regulator, arsenate/arsenite/antimonite-responsive transcriptional repressor
MKRLDSPADRRHGLPECQKVADRPSLAANGEEKMLHRVFKALADPTRLRILNLLMESPLCVCEFGRVLRLSQPHISRHLAYLKNAGLIQDHRQGMRVQYSMNVNNKGQQELEHFLRHTLSSDLTCRDDLRRWRQIEEEPASRPRDEVASAVGIN